jgi:hypothetical protein
MLCLVVLISILTSTILTLFFNYTILLFQTLPGVILLRCLLDLHFSLFVLTSSLEYFLSSLVLGFFITLLRIARYLCLLLFSFPSGISSHYNRLWLLLVTSSILSLFILMSTTTINPRLLLLHLLHALFLMLRMLFNCMCCRDWPAYARRNSRRFGWTTFNFSISAHR